MTLSTRQISERLVSYAEHLESLGLVAEADETRDIADSILFESPDEWDFHADVIDSHRCVDDDEETRDRTDASAWAYLVACALLEGVQS